MFLQGDIFNTTGTGIVGEHAAPQNPTTGDSTNVDKKDRWFESPLMFIFTIVLMLVTIRFVERKVG